MAKKNSTCPTCNAPHYSRSFLRTNKNRVRVQAKPEYVTTGNKLVKRYKEYIGDDEKGMPMYEYEYKLAPIKERIKPDISIRVYWDKIWNNKRFVRCPDPWHRFNDKPKSEHKVIPPRVHHPDLSENKKYLKRKLQDKHRR